MFHQTNTLTTAIDTLTGTAGDDIFVGDNATASAADSISGGAGVDTVKIFGTATLPSMSGVENLEIHHATAVSVNIESGNLADVVSLTLDGLTLNDTTVTLGNGETLVLRDAVGAASADINITGSATTLLTANLVVENSGNATDALDIDIIGTLLDTINLTSQGADAINYVNIATSGTPTMTTLNITATGKGLVVEDVDDATTINASASTANITLSNAVDKATVTFGSGDDIYTMAHGDSATQATIDMGAGDDKVSITSLDAANVLTDDKFILKGGAGTDTLSGEEALFAELGALTAANFAKKGISGFEKIEFDDTGADGATYDLANFGVNYLILTVDDADDNTITGVTSGFTLELGAAVDNIGGSGSTDDYTITLTDRAGSGDRVNFVIKNTAGAGDFEFAAAELEIVSITSTASTQANTVDLNMAQLEQIYVTAGTGNVTVNLADTGNAGLNVSLVDASGSVSTGGIVFTADGSNLAGITFKGGSGGDEFNGGDLSDVVIAGSGDDIIDVAAGSANTVNLSAGGADKIEINSLTGFTTVTGFSSNDDIDIENVEIHTATVVYTGQITGTLDLTDENVLISTINASTTALKAGGSETIADFKSMADVAAYLEEVLDVLSAEDVGVVLNDGTNSYVYHVDVDVLNSTTNKIDAADVTLLMMVENFILNGDHVIVSP